MNAVDGVLLADARQTLLHEVTEARGACDLPAAFAAWLLPDQIDGLRHGGLTTEAIGASGAQRTYQHVALLGYASQFLTFQNPELALLKSGLTWLAGRIPVVDGTPMGFSTDAVALLGVSLGAKRVGEAAITGKVTKLLVRCIDACEKGHGIEDWQQWLLAAAAAQVDAAPPSNLPTTQATADVRVALYSRGLLSQLPKGQLEQDAIEMLGLVQREQRPRLGIPRAALRLAALDWVKGRQPTITIKNAAIEDLCALLRNVPAGLKRWTWEDQPRTRASTELRRWHVDNEYHVQNLLWFLLAPLFPELTDEEYTPKVGSVQPRADICIPWLRVIVEVKFLRAKDAPKKVIEEIATDASLYLPAQSGYDCVIAFIWDDSRRSEIHAELIRGLRAIRGVYDAIVVGRPGSMT